MAKPKLPDPIHRDGFFLFWGGWPSNWYASPFVLDGVRFSCVEQWMMWSKAQLFDDAEAATKILAATTPRQQKQLGREVRSFDANRWAAVSRDVVYRGSVEKYRQNPELAHLLRATGSDVIVEASPEDRIWGIGLAQDHPDATIPTRWQGTNWLGEVLMRVRNDLGTP
jgi:ribA/ribD-fused uncharacterized protein